MGILYGVSTGPGDPELLTLKAVRILEQCRVIAAPQKPDGASTALRIAGGAVDLTGKHILPLSFPMTEDETVLRENDRRIAAMLCEVLTKEDAAVLCLGDISLYATFQPVAALVRQAGFQTESVPGITSFCAAAARSGVPLTGGDTPLQILPYGCECFAERLRLPGAKVIMKCGSRLPILLKLLDSEGMLGRAYAVENCGMENERYLPVLHPDTVCGYFTVVYIAPEENGNVPL